MLSKSTTFLPSISLLVELSLLSICCQSYKFSKSISSPKYSGTAFVLSIYTCLVSFVINVFVISFRILLFELFGSAISLTFVVKQKCYARERCDWPNSIFSYFLKFVEIVSICVASKKGLLLWFSTRTVALDALEINSNVNTSFYNKISHSESQIVTMQDIIWLNTLIY